MRLLTPDMGTEAVRIVSERKLKEFAKQHKNAKNALRDWATAVESATWKNPAELRRMFGTADFVGDKTVFDVGGNKHRLIAYVHYRAKIVYRKHVLTHAEYAKGLEMILRGSIALAPNYYAELLKEALPRVVHTEEENERLLAEIEKLLAKGEGSLSLEEEELLELLTQLVEAFERRAYPRKKASPAELVSFLLEQRGLIASNLWPVLGSKGRVSDLLNGRREVSKEQAKKLGEFFHVSPAAFI